MSPARNNLLKILIAALTIAYPFIVYFGLTTLSPGVFGLLFALLVALRLQRLSGDLRKPLAAGSALLLLYAALVVWTNSETLLRIYPVLVNLLALALFMATLFKPHSMIERLCRAAGMDVPDEAIVYTRRLTMVWSGFFIVNAGIALFTATAASRTVWAVYNGFLSYALMGALLGGEYLFRQYYRRK